MRAVRVNSFGGPEVLRLEEVPDPRPPGAGEVLVRMHAAGVNPVDTYLRAGQYAMPASPALHAGRRRRRRGRGRGVERRARFRLGFSGRRREGLRRARPR